jgi:TIGR03009 family protein
MAPFSLTPQQQAQLDMVLRAWEARNAGIRTLSTDFTMLEFEQSMAPAGPGQQQPHRFEGAGQIKYVAPDKGVYKVETLKVFNPRTNQWSQANELAEHFVCDGKSVFQYRSQEKTLVEYPLPPQARGIAAAEGTPIFVFSAKAEQLKQRYFLRITTPPNAAGQVWIEVHPRTQRDAASFSKMEIILAEKTMTPQALQIYQPGADINSPYADRKVFIFNAPSVNSVVDQLKWFNVMTPLGWKRVVEDGSQAADAAPSGPPQVAPGAAPGRPGPAPAIARPPANPPR